MGMPGDSSQKILLKGSEQSLDYFTSILKEAKDKGGQLKFNNLFLQVAGRGGTIE
jgi:hypothetical protein